MLGAQVVAVEPRVDSAIWTLPAVVHVARAVVGGGVLHDELDAQVDQLAQRRAIIAREHVGVERRNGVAAIGSQAEGVRVHHHRRSGSGGSRSGGEDQKTNGAQH